MTRVPAEIPWHRLSAKGRTTLRYIARPISEGFSHSDLARMYGIPEARVTKLMRELREELTGDVRPCETCGEPVAVSAGRTCSDECRRTLQRRTLKGRPRKARSADVR